MVDVTKEQYTDDAPITSHRDDRFGRWAFSERLAQVIATRTDPASIVIGIYGPWGDGKTSVLNMMREALSEHEHTIVIQFNPWHFENEGQLIRAFFDTLADAIGKSLTTTKEDIGQFLSKYGGVLSYASLPFGVDAGTATTTIGDKLSNVALDDLKARVSTILVEAHKRVVVFVDDIDRLDRGEVHAILKLIKLSASFHNTAYVLAFDDEMVAASLGDRYGAGGPAAGHSFIEKIIQVPLHLPDAEADDLQQLAFEGVDDVLRANSIDLSQSDAESFALAFHRGILPVLDTPRQVKRYVNAIRFAVPLLRGEVHAVDQLLLEALRAAYPNLYLSVRANEDVYTGQRFTDTYGNATKEKEDAKAVVEEGFNGLSSDRREAALYVLKVLFPRLEGVFGNTSYGNDWNERWAKDRRITSSDYFRRYFQYGVPGRDVADADVEGIITAANAPNPDAVIKLFAKITERKAWGAALDKLFARLTLLTPNGARTIAIALASIGDQLPYSSGFFSEIMAARNRAASLAVRAVQRIPDQHSRLLLARDLIMTARPLAFGTECLRWLDFKSEKIAGMTALSEAEMKEVGAVLAGRIQAEITAAPNYQEYGRKIGTFLHVWKTFGPDGQMAEFLTQRIASDPMEALRLLDAFIGRSVSMETGVSHKSDFGRSEFDAIASFISPQTILDALKEVFGAAVDDATFEKCWEYQDDKRTACRFAAIFKRVQQENEAKSATPGSTVHDTTPSNAEANTDE